MPRARTQPAAVTPAIATDVVAGDLAAHDQQAAHLITVDETYGDGGIPYDRERVVHEIRWHLAQSSESMLEAGRRLILLREHEAHGDFLAALDRVGVVPRTAQRLMQAAVKFGGRPQLAGVGKSKLLELAFMDEDEIDLLSEGGTVLGVDLDDIDRMTVAELRETIRKERAKHHEDAEVSGRLLTAKNEKLDELAAALDRRDNLAPADAAGDASAAVWDAAMQFLGPYEALRGAMFEAAALRETQGSVPASLYRAQCDALVYLMWRLEELRQELGLVDVDLQSVVTPPWEEGFKSGSDESDAGGD